MLQHIHTSHLKSGIRKSYRYSHYQLHTHWVWSGGVATCNAFLYDHNTRQKVYDVKLIKRALKGVDGISFYSTKWMAQVASWFSGKLFKVRSGQGEVWGVVR